METPDRQALAKLLHDFYNLIGAKVGVYDAEGKELCCYPAESTAFCRTLQEDEGLGKGCRECNRNAFATCQKTRKPYVSTCHAGVRDCVSPLLCDGQVVGFLAVGRVKGDGPDLPATLSETRRTALGTAYGSLPAPTEDRLLSALHILEACADYAPLKTLLLRDPTAIETRIAAYVNENPASPLSVSHLCSKFHLSRHEIYRIANLHFGCGPAEYVKSCRLAHARHLLITTGLPVHQIAAQCGIPDYNYFSKVFKAAHGISPTEYRRNPPQRT